MAMQLLPCGPDRVGGLSARPRRRLNVHGSRLPRASTLRSGAVASSSSSSSSSSNALDMKERMAFLQEDLTHLFDEQGVDETQYDDVVAFLDPITKYNNVQGYMFNIRMLKTVFDPAFELHDIKQTGPYDITTRWTMSMKFTPADKLGLGRWWSPVITFTGTSTYGFNPANGRINRHVDTWDSISNQQYFSLEAFGDFFSQLLQTHTTPKLATPAYTLLRRTAHYQVRRYEPFLVAEAPLDWTTSAATNTTTSSSSSSSSSFDGSGATGSNGRPVPAAAVNPASAGVQAFRALVEYITGGNAAGEQFAMTTPVLTSSSGTMQFVIDLPAGKGPADLPRASQPQLSTKQVPGGCYAVAVFSGVATPSRASEVEAALRQQLAADGLRPAGADEWVLARYNDPSVKPARRRNEVLLPLAEFDVWA